MAMSPCVRLIGLLGGPWIRQDSLSEGIVLVDVRLGPGDYPGVRMRKRPVTPCLPCSADAAGPAAILPAGSEAVHREGSPTTHACRDRWPSSVPGCGPGGSIRGR